MIANATVTCKNASSLYHFRKRFPFCFFIFILFFTPLPLVSKMNPQAHSSLRILPSLSRLLGCNDGWTTTRLWVVMVTWLFKTGWSLIMVGLGSLFLSHGVVLDFYFIFLSCWFCFGFVAVVDYYYYYFLFRRLTWFFFFFWVVNNDRKFGLQFVMLGFVIVVVGQWQIWFVVLICGDW